MWFEEGLGLIVFVYDLAVIMITMITMEIIEFKEG